MRQAKNLEPPYGRFADAKSWLTRRRLVLDGYWSYGHDVAHGLKIVGVSLMALGLVAASVTFAAKKMARFTKPSHRHAPTLEYKTSEGARGSFRPMQGDVAKVLLRRSSGAKEYN